MEAILAINEDVLNQTLLKQLTDFAPTQEDVSNADQTMIYITDGRH
jgi:hypothetical protein